MLSKCPAVALPLAIAISVAPGARAQDLRSQMFNLQLDQQRTLNELQRSQSDQASQQLNQQLDQAVAGCVQLAGCRQALPGIMQEMQREMEVIHQKVQRAIDESNREVARILSR